MKFKHVKVLIGFLLLFTSFSIKVKATDTMPSVGINEMVKDITEDQARWAYAKVLGEELQKLKEELASEDLRFLSSIIWCEAGNQCEAGKQAVGIVVMNRVDHEAFEDTIKEVIYEKGQFRPKDDGQLNKALKMYDDGELPQECIDAARYALSGETTVTYNDKEIDMSPYLYFARHWTNARIRIEDHDFK